MVGANNKFVQDKRTSVYFKESKDDDWSYFDKKGLNDGANLVG